MKKYQFVASACLCGLKCKYNGGSNPSAELVRLYGEGRVLALCPETLAGLNAPRPPAEILADGHVVSKNGADLDAEFKAGADKALEIALQAGCKRAIVKSRSPSCGYGQIYDGTFSGGLRPGNGKWTDKLIDAGFEIWTEENLPADIL